MENYQELHKPVEIGDLLILDDSVERGVPRIKPDAERSMTGR